jgi:hypothetical protein
MKSPAGWPGLFFSANDLIYEASGISVTLRLTGHSTFGRAASAGSLAKSSSALPGALYD